MKKQNLILAILAGIWLMILFSVIRSHNKEAFFILPIFTIIIIIYLGWATYKVISWNHKNNKDNSNESTEKDKNETKNKQ